MTEQEWLVCEDAWAMLRFLGHTSERKLRLFLCGGARHSWRLLDEQCQLAIVGAEQFADGMCSQAKLRELNASAWIIAKRMAGTPGMAVRAVAWATAGTTGRGVIRNGLRTAFSARIGSDQLKLRWNELGVPARRELANFADFLRHIIGNPFRPYQAPSSWPASVVKLAQAAYDQQPVHFALHDALLEAGYAELAEHLKESYHPKGCWVLDAILGKS